MFKKSEIFYPKNAYIGINFEQIKNDLKKLKFDYDDYGSIFVIKKTNQYITVNNMGKTEIFYNDVENNNLNQSILQVEHIFKKAIKDFSIIH